MIKIPTLLLFVILSCSLVQSKLLYMSTVFRHGARYPINNMYDGKDMLEFHGNLTSVGLREHYLLGNYVRNDYVNNKSVGLLQETLQTREIEIFTLTDQKRCIESAYAHALGLFPFQFGQKIDSNIDPKLLDPPFETILPSNLVSEEAPSDYALQSGYQPIPVRYGDIFFPQCHKSPEIYIKRGEVIAKQLTEFQIQYSLFTEQMTKLFNIPLPESNIGGLVALYDTLVCDFYLDRKMPDQFTDRDYQTLMFIHRYTFSIVFENQPSRIFNAPYVNNMLSNMEKVIQQKLDAKKLSVYSGHDTNVVPLMVFYNLTSSDCLKKLWMDQTVVGNCAVPIPFASNIFFQLHQDDKNSSNYFVKVRYNGKYFNLCGKNSTECSFSEFAQKSRAHLMDFDKQCGTKTSQKLENSPFDEISKISKFSQIFSKMSRKSLSSIKSALYSNGKNIQTLIENVIEE